MKGLTKDLFGLGVWVICSHANTAAAYNQSLGSCFHLFLRDRVHGEEDEVGLCEWRQYR